MNKWPFGLSAAMALAGVLALSPSAFAANVVASIKPVDALVSAVMQGVGTPHLLISGNASPHAYSLRPSDAEALQNADLIFWVSDELETFLVKPIQTLGLDAKSVMLEESPGLALLSVRVDAAFEAHDQSAEGHGTEDHGEEEHDEEVHDEHAHDEGHDAHSDAHFWLDPLNAKAMVQAIATALSTADPANAPLYAANAKKTEQALDGLITEIQGSLAPVKAKPFIVFHDAYQYFEHRFDIHAAGAITLNPEAIPGAKRVAEIRETIKRLGAVCVFAEPQFTPRQVETLVADTGVKHGVLDPLGADIFEGPDHYFNLLRAIAASLKTCLSD